MIDVEFRSQSHQKVRYQYKEDGFNDARKCNCATVVSAESFILRISRWKENYLPNLLASLSSPNHERTEQS